VPPGVRDDGREGASGQTPAGGAGHQGPRPDGDRTTSAYRTASPVRSRRV
jgi:hypothetical protein